MGGSSSTRWGGAPGRVCVEASYALAPPRGRLHAGEWEAEWPRSGVSVLCRLSRDGEGGYTVALRHNWRGGGFQIVRLAATRPHFSRGGSRWWFVCPGCGRRAGRLHLPYRGPAAREFKCRRCHDLTYESAQLSRSKARATYLALAREWGCTYAEARDFFRREIGGHLHRPAHLYFGPRKVRIG